MLAAIFAIFGGVYAFILKWGPLIWGLIGILLGFVLGLIIKLIITKKYNNRQRDKRSTEVVLIIECLEDQLQMVKDTLWSHNALGVSKLDIDNAE